MKNKTNNRSGADRFGFAFTMITIFICLISISQASAQTDETKKIEVSAGYSYTKAPELFETALAPNGWTVGAGFRFTKKVSVYGEFGQDRGTKHPGGGVDLTSTRTSALGGIRFHFVNSSRITPFVNAGLGYGQFSTTVRLVSSTVKVKQDPNLLLAAGGGIDVALTKKGAVNWRTAIEYRRVEAGEIYQNNMFLNSSRNAFRLSTGVVFRF